MADPWNSDTRNSRGYYDPSTARWVAWPDPDAEALRLPRPTSVGWDAPPAEPAAHTWRPLDLVALGSTPPSPPEVGDLFHLGCRHVISGEFDAGKSMLLLAISAAELRAGHGVVWVDADRMGASMALERLRAFGASDEAIRELFAWLAPEEALSDAAREDVLALIGARGARLVVGDAFNSLLFLHGLSPEKTAEVEQFWRGWALPFQQASAAVVLPDHVVKHKESRGRYAYGSERKATGADVHLGFSVLESFGRGKRGKAKLLVHRDRLGFLAAGPPSIFVLDSDPESGRLAWQLEPDQSIGPDNEFRPTGLMEKVSRFLELAGEARSRSQIVESVPGNTPAKRIAIDRLVHEEFAVEFSGDRAARMVQLQQPFREADEWGEQ
jgi:hypothetical protein